MNIIIILWPYSHYLSYQLAGGTRAGVDKLWILSVNFYTISVEYSWNSNSDNVRLHCTVLQFNGLVRSFN